MEGKVTMAEVSKPEGGASFNFSIVRSNFLLLPSYFLWLLGELKPLQ